MTETVSIRVPEQDMKEIKKLSKELNAKRSELLREILSAGIREKKFKMALDKFIRKELTAWKAARLAGIPLTKFLDSLKEKGIEFHYSEKELEEEFEGL